MPNLRLWRRVQGQGGFTLVELLVAMSIASVLLGLVVQALGRASQDQQDIERRSQMQTDAQIGLERMTRELRQASWLHFRSSSVVDIAVKVRPTSTGYGVPRLVRFDCSQDVCSRMEGPAVTYPPPPAPAFERTETIVGGDFGSRRGRIAAHDVFRPSRIDPATGQAVTDYAAPDFVSVRLQVEIDQLYDGKPRLFHVEDGVSLRNRTGYAP